MNRFILVGIILLFIAALAIGLSSLFSNSEPIACTADAQLCSDGSYVGRVPPACEFAPCPGPTACTLDAKICPDGSYVGRIGPNCEFAPCPGA